LRRDIGSTKRTAGTTGRGTRGYTVGILGAVKRGEPVPASMKDLIYIHRRKTRKTVYQKSYRADSSRRVNERERKRENERERERERERNAGRARERKKEGYTTAEMKLSVHGLPPTSLCPRISALPLPILSFPFSFPLTASPICISILLYSKPGCNAYSISLKRYLNVTMLRRKILKSSLLTDLRPSIIVHQQTH